jgi:hypothetical protein
VQETVVPPDVCVPDGTSCVIVETGTISGSLTGPGTVDILRNITYGPVPGCLGLAGTSDQAVTIVTRSGGTLSVETVGTFCVAGGGATETGALTITGGTGRFAGTSGTGSYSIHQSPVAGNGIENWAGVLT